jgi:predicted lipase
MAGWKIALMAAILCVSIHSYSTAIANELAHISAIAYESQANIDGWKCSECSKFTVKSQKSFFSSVANIQGYGFYDVKNNAVTISFRGSADIKNWIYNLNTVIVNYPGCSGCQVHQGFYSAYTGVAPLVRTMVSSLLSLYRGAKLVITGHSLGGAMAVLCSLDMKEIHGKVDYVYTYGQPRVGNQNFANFYQTQIANAFRVINYADMVPHVPP